MTDDVLEAVREALEQNLADTTGMCLCDEAYTIRDLIDPLCCWHEAVGTTDAGSVDRVIAAFRRSVVPVSQGEPSDADGEIPTREHGQLEVPSDAPSFVAAQGEPSEAQVLAGAYELDEAAMDAPGDYPLAYEAAVSTLRAVLRAAGVVSEEPAGVVEYRVFDSEGELWAGSSSLDEARRYLGHDPTGCPRIERAVWVPVKQEGAGR